MISDKMATIVNGIFSMSQSKRHYLKHITLQKFFYLACGYWYATADRWPLDEGDDFEAWERGPVLPSLYQQYCDVESEFIPPGILPSNEPLLPSMQYTIQKVFEKYSIHDDISLSDLTHKKDTPWYKALASKGDNKIIDKKDIKQHFIDLLGISDMEILDSNMHNIDHSNAIAKLEEVKLSILT